MVSHIITIKSGLANGDVVNATIVGGAVVDLSSCQAACAIVGELYRDVLHDNVWCDVVLNGHIKCGGADVARQVDRYEGHGNNGTGIGTIEVGDVYVQRIHRDVVRSGKVVAVLDVQHNVAVVIEVEGRVCACNGRRTKVKQWLGVLIVDHNVHAVCGTHVAKRVYQVGAEGVFTILQYRTRVDKFEVDKAVVDVVVGQDHNGAVSAAFKVEDDGITRLCHESFGH